MNYWDYRNGRVALSPRHIESWDLLTVGITPSRIYPGSPWQINPMARAAEAGWRNALTSAMIDLASRYSRYGYRRITALLRRDGWHVNHKRVARIWRREGLRVPQKQPKRGRLQLNDGSCVRLRTEHPNQDWAYHFVQDRTHDGRTFRMLTVINEFTRECLAIDVARPLNSQSVLAVLADLMPVRGVPDHIRSDNGLEFAAIAVRQWIT